MPRSIEFGPGGLVDADTRRAIDAPEIPSRPLAEPPAPKPAAAQPPLGPGELIRQAKRRRRELGREITRRRRELQRLETEKIQLSRLLDAAGGKQLASVTAIKRRAS